ncbi:GFA family protein [Luminiphilus sp.]|nr:GFA family protein [Luminiphilus sp.]
MMPVDGACLCGDITWEATLDTELVVVCHCGDCQTVGASAFQFAARISRKHFNLTNGTLNAYIKTAESGRARAMSFCGRCATMIHTSNTDGTGPLSVRLGGCRQKHALTPRFQIWCQSSLPWVEIEAGVRLPRQT